MFSFFKPKIRADEVADILIEGIQRDVANGQVNKPFMDEITFDDRSAIREEWFYFDVFNVDYFVFLAFGERIEKKLILDAFWLKMRQWLGTSEVSALPPRQGFYAGDLKTVPGEQSELEWDRGRRRCAIYLEAVNTQHPLGENHSVAVAFGILSGDSDLTHLAGFAGYFHKRK